MCEAPLSRNILTVSRGSSSLMPVRSALMMARLFSPVNGVRSIERASSSTACDFSGRGGGGRRAC
ncbi:MAG: hypothetical protein IJP39_03115, partial [Bacteroidales bacterium]|nr:hypothetical protein [Bacteroidales bacterium]